MKNVLMMAMLVVSFATFAQNNKPQLEAVGDMVKVTYLHDNGQVQQQGFYKNGKLQGEWVSYDANGNRTAVAVYAKGEKTGTWLFWNDTVLSEVNYSNNQIASVKNWKKDALVNVE
jgi:antitoxin component YwqK of YwqJK toxin-antitoxin module